ncbi:unnamed protein product [Amoebophrya sp. A25]|nr:unnamed protein product [Amoebophrya sp. A25]|eukprot:GSA25T00005374001.1
MIRAQHANLIRREQAEHEGKSNAAAQLYQQSYSSSSCSSIHPFPSSEYQGPAKGGQKKGGRGKKSQLQSSFRGVTTRGGSHQLSDNRNWLTDYSQDERGEYAFHSDGTVAMSRHTNEESTHCGQLQQLHPSQSGPRPPRPARLKGEQKDKQGQPTCSPRGKAKGNGNTSGLPLSDLSCVETRSSLSLATASSSSKSVSPSERQINPGGRTGDEGPYNSLDDQHLVPFRGESEDQQLDHQNQHGQGAGGLHDTHLQQPGEDKITGTMTSSTFTFAAGSGQCEGRSNEVRFMEPLRKGSTSSSKLRTFDDLVGSETQGPAPNAIISRDVAGDADCDPGGEDAHFLPADGLFLGKAGCIEQGVQTDIASLDDGTEARDDAAIRNMSQEALSELSVRVLFELLRRGKGSPANILPLQHVVSLSSTSSGAKSSRSFRSHRDEGSLEADDCKSKYKHGETCAITDKGNRGTAAEDNARELHGPLLLMDANELPSLASHFVMDQGVDKSVSVTNPQGDGCNMTLTGGDLAGVTAKWTNGNAAGGSSSPAAAASASTSRKEPTASALAAASQVIYSSASQHNTTSTAISSASSSTMLPIFLSESSTAPVGNESNRNCNSATHDTHQRLRHSKMLAGDTTDQGDQVAVGLSSVICTTLAGVASQSAAMQSVEATSSLLLQQQRLLPEPDTNYYNIQQATATAGKTGFNIAPPEVAAAPWFSNQLLLANEQSRVIARAFPHLARTALSAAAPHQQNSDLPMLTAMGPTSSFMNGYPKGKARVTEQQQQEQLMFQQSPALKLKSPQQEPQQRGMLHRTPSLGVSNVGTGGLSEASGCNAKSRVNAQGHSGGACYLPSHVAPFSTPLQGILFTAAAAAANNGTFASATNVSFAASVPCFVNEDHGLHANGMQYRSFASSSLQQLLTTEIGQSQFHAPNPYFDGDAPASGSTGQNLFLPQHAVEDDSAFADVGVERVVEDVGGEFSPATDFSQRSFHAVQNHAGQAEKVDIKRNLSSTAEENIDAAPAVALSAALTLELQQAHQRPCSSYLQPGPMSVLSTPSAGIGNLFCATSISGCNQLSNTTQEYTPSPANSKPQVVNVAPVAETGITVATINPHTDATDRNPVSGKGEMIEHDEEVGKGHAAIDVNGKGNTSTSRTAETSNSRFGSHGKQDSAACSRTSSKRVSTSPPETGKGAAAGQAYHQPLAVAASFSSSFSSATSSSSSAATYASAVAKRRQARHLVVQDSYKRSREMAAGYHGGNAGGEPGACGYAKHNLPEKVHSLFESGTVVQRWKSFTRGAKYDEDRRRRMADARLENISWRLWFRAQRAAAEKGARQAERRLALEQGREVEEDGMCGSNAAESDPTFNNDGAASSGSPDHDNFYGDDRDQSSSLERFRNDRAQTKHPNRAPGPDGSVHQNRRDRMYYRAADRHYTYSSKRNASTEVGRGTRTGCIPARRNSADAALAKLPSRGNQSGEYQGGKRCGFTGATDSASVNGGLASEGHARQKTSAMRAYSDDCLLQSMSNLTRSSSSGSGPRSRRPQIGHVRNFSARNGALSTAERASLSSHEKGEGSTPPKGWQRHSEPCKRTLPEEDYHYYQARGSVAADGGAYAGGGGECVASDGRGHRVPGHGDTLDSSRAKHPAPRHVGRHSGTIHKTKLAAMGATRRRKRQESDMSLCSEERIGKLLSKYAERSDENPGTCDFRVGSRGCDSRHSVEQRGKGPRALFTRRSTVDMSAESAPNMDRGGSMLADDELVRSLRAVCSPPPGLENEMDYRMSKRPSTVQLSRCSTKSLNSDYPTFCGSQRPTDSYGQDYSGSGSTRVLGGVEQRKIGVASGMHSSSSSKSQSQLGNSENQQWVCEPCDDDAGAHALAKDARGEPGENSNAEKYNLTHNAFTDRAAGSSHGSRAGHKAWRRPSLAQSVSRPPSDGPGGIKENTMLRDVVASKQQDHFLGRDIEAYRGPGSSHTTKNTNKPTRSFNMYEWVLVPFPCLICSEASCVCGVERPRWAKSKPPNFAPIDETCVLSGDELEVGNRNSVFGGPAPLLEEGSSVGPGLPQPWQHLPGTPGSLRQGSSMSTGPAARLSMMSTATIPRSGSAETTAGDSPLQVVGIPSPRFSTAMSYHAGYTNLLSSRRESEVLEVDFWHRPLTGGGSDGEQVPSGGFLNARNVTSEESGGARESDDTSGADDGEDASANNAGTTAARSNKAAHGRSKAHSAGKNRISNFSMKKFAAAGQPVSSTTEIRGGPRFRHSVPPRFVTHFAPSSGSKSSRDSLTYSQTTFENEADGKSSGHCLSYPPPGLSPHAYPQSDHSGLQCEDSSAILHSAGAWPSTEARWGRSSSRDSTLPNGFPHPEPGHLEVDDSVRYDGGALDVHKERATTTCIGVSLPGTSIPPGMESEFLRRNCISEIDAVTHVHGTPQGYTGQDAVPRTSYFMEDMHRYSVASYEVPAPGATTGSTPGGSRPSSTTVSGSGVSGQQKQSRENVKVSSERSADLTCSTSPQDTQKAGVSRQHAWMQKQSARRLPSTMFQPLMPIRDADHDEEISQWKMSSSEAKVALSKTGQRDAARVENQTWRKWVMQRVRRRGAEQASVASSMCVSPARLYGTTPSPSSSSWLYVPPREQQHHLSDAVAQYYLRHKQMPPSSSVKDQQSEEGEQMEMDAAAMERQQEETEKQADTSELRGNDDAGVSDGSHAKLIPHLPTVVGESCGRNEGEEPTQGAGAANAVEAED